MIEEEAPRKAQQMSSDVRSVPNLKSVWGRLLCNLQNIISDDINNDNIYIDQCSELAKEEDPHFTVHSVDDAGGVAIRFELSSNK